MNIEHFLESFGLTDKEIRIYLALLPRGQAPASSIAKAVGYPRSTTRFTLEALVEKGLVTETTQHNSSIYLAESPDKLGFLLEREEEKLSQRKDQLDRVMSELKLLHNPSSIIPRVKVYEGVAEALNMLTEIADEAGEKELYAVGAADYATMHTPELIEEFRSKTRPKYEKIRVIRSPIHKANAKVHERSQLETKYFLKRHDDVTVEIHITDKSVGITSFPEGTAIGVKIQHDEIAKTFAHIFHELWEHL